MTSKINVDVKEEEILWEDKKRGIFGLPWTFTKYKLTPSRLIIETGFINSNVDEIRLYRIKDLSYHQTLGEKIWGLGCIKVISSDASVPQLIIKRIKNSKKVKEILSQTIENARVKAGVRASELMSAGYAVNDDDEHGNFGENIVPDFNHNGIDDRTE